MVDIIVYSSANCSYCEQAKQLLDNKGVSYQEIRIDELPDKREEMMQRTGRRSVPQIIIDNKAVGGFSDLWDLDKAGKLDSMLGL